MTIKNYNEVVSALAALLMQFDKDLNQYQTRKNRQQSLTLSSMLAAILGLMTITTQYTLTKNTILTVSATTSRPNRNLQTHLKCLSTIFPKP